MEIRNLYNRFCKKKIHTNPFTFFRLFFLSFLSFEVQPSKQYSSKVALPVCESNERETFNSLQCNNSGLILKRPDVYPPQSPLVPVLGRIFPYNPSQSYSENLIFQRRVIHFHGPLAPLLLTSPQSDLIESGPTPRSIFPLSKSNVTVTTRVECFPLKIITVDL